MQTNNRVILDFTSQDFSDAAVLAEKKSIIHIHEFRRVLELIDESIQISQKCKNVTGELKRLHNTITILGSRGAGKTTFIKTLYSELNKSERKNEKEEERKLLLIDIIDPTLHDSDQKILIDIISCIKAKVELMMHDNCNNWECRDHRSHRDYEKWRKSLNEMATGLATLQGVGSERYKDWDDAEYIVEKGFESAIGAFSLEKRLHEFIQCALEITQKDVLVLSFDDIDTKCQKGWEILETIRKYLTSPQLITILSGDLELYSLLVRDKQIHNFSDKLITFYPIEKDNVFSMVNRLESQYLLKILKPERRVMLTSLFEKFNSSLYNIYIKAHNHDDTFLEKSLIEVYDDIIQKMGINTSNWTYCSDVKDLLLKQSLRTQLRVLVSWFAQLKKNEFISDIFIKTFWTQISQMGLNPIILKEQNDTILQPILKALIDNDLLETGYRMLPYVSDSDKNLALMVFGACINEKIKDEPSLIYDYLIRVCHTRESSRFLHSESKNQKNNVVENENIEDLIKYAHLYNDSGLKKTFCLTDVFMYNYLIKSNIENSQFGSYIYYSAENNLSDKKNNIINYQISLLPIFKSLNNGIEKFKISFFALIGCIGDFYVNIKPRLHNKDVALRELKNLLSFHSQVKQFVGPNNINSKYKKDNLDDKYFIEGIKYDLYNKFVSVENNQSGLELDELYNWFSIKNIPVSVSLLSGIYTRFLFCIKSMEQELLKKNKQVTLDQWMTVNCTAFFNAVLIENALNKGLMVYDYDLNHPSFENCESVFFNNLIKFLADYEICDGLGMFMHENANKEFLFYIMTCPLLKIFWNSDILKLNFKCLLSMNSLGKFKIKGLFKSEDISLYIKWVRKTDYYKSNSDDYLQELSIIQKRINEIQLQEDCLTNRKNELNTLLMKCESDLRQLIIKKDEILHNILDIQMKLNDVNLSYRQTVDYLEYDSSDYEEVQKISSEINKLTTSISQFEEYLSNENKNLNSINNSIELIERYKVEFRNESESIDLNIHEAIDEKDNLNLKLKQKKTLREQLNREINELRQSIQINLDSFELDKDKDVDTQLVYIYSLFGRNLYGNSIVSFKN